jgi:CBS domain-containing protein
MPTPQIAKHWRHGRASKGLYVEVNLMSFRSVATYVNDTCIGLSRLRSGEEPPLKDEDTALSAMSDFHQVCPVKVEPEWKIDAAPQIMIDARARNLLVASDGQMIGLITADDIQGQKPLQFLRGSDCVHSKCRHEAIEVADIMTPVAALPSLRLEDVRKARIGDIVKTFCKTRQTHLLVTERKNDQGSGTGGWISGAKIERRRGVSPTQASAARIEQEISMFPRLPA